MKFTHYISAFVLALLLVPGVALVAQAETNSSSDATLEELVEKLTDRVTALEKDLEKAETRIAELEKKVADAKTVRAEVKEKVKSKWNGDVNEKGQWKVCHQGTTIEVSGWAAAAHKIHHPGDFLGECNEGEDDDDMEDDDDKDDDKDDDDSDDKDDDEDDDD
jgi:hypothetical protein